jgi:hypothetical protein
MSLTRKFTNLVKGTLDAALGSVELSTTVNFDTDFTVPTGLTGGVYMMMTIDPDAVEGDAPEIVKVTAISGSSNPYNLTIVRSQEGTSAQNWDTGRRIVAAVTAAIYNEFLITSDNLSYDHTNERLGIRDAGTDSGWPGDALHIRHSDPTIHLENTATGADCYVRANESDGSIVIEADKNDEATGTSAVLLKTANATRLTANATGVTIVGVLAKTSGTFDIPHPVLGDDLHTPSDTRVLRGGGMFLAAVGLRLPHPTTGEPLEIDIPEPPKFETFRAREARRARS